MDPRAPADGRPDHRSPGARRRRPGGPRHPRRVGEHGLARGAGGDDARRRLARYLANLAGKAGELGLQIVETTVNGRPGLAGRIGGETVLVLAFGVEGGRIRNLWAVVNPAKLIPWNSNAPRH